LPEDTHAVADTDADAVPDASYADTDTDGNSHRRLLQFEMGLVLLLAREVLRRGDS
jgi:hypothetical protein